MPLLPWPENSDPTSAEEDAEKERARQAEAERELQRQ